MADFKESLQPSSISKFGHVLAGENSMGDMQTLLAVISTYLAVLVIGVE